jgi:hypothetical protein
MDICPHYNLQKNYFERGTVKLSSSRAVLSMVNNVFDEKELLPSPMYLTELKTNTLEKFLQTPIAGNRYVSTGAIILSKHLWTSLSLEVDMKEISKEWSERLTKRHLLEFVLFSYNQPI